MSAVDIRQMSESFDMGARRPDGFGRRMLFVVALAWSCYQLWVVSPLPALTGILLIDEIQHRIIHVAFAMFLGFCAYPALARAPVARIPVYDWVLACCAAASCLYIVVFYADVAEGAGGVRSAAERIVAIVGVLCVLELSRRTLGLPLLIVTIVFLLYMFFGPYMPDLIAHRGATLNRAIDHLWFTSEGVFGIAAGVSASTIFLFVLFGALLQRAGSGNYLIQLSIALLGHLRGGPAKASVVASGLTGMISGSTIANIVTTGTFTIPLMKRVGYPGYKAGAIETSASLNGQVMPPVMGAAAFIMTEFIGISYLDVVKHAFLPAVISYVALFFIVHAEAEKAGMPVLERVAQSSFLRRAVVAVTCVLVAVVGSLAIHAVGTGLRALLGSDAYLAGIALFTAVYIGGIAVAVRMPPIRLDDPNSPEIHIPSAWPTFLAGLYYLLPIMVLVWCLMVERLSAGLAVYWAILAQVAILVTQHALKAALTGRGDAVGSALRTGLIDLVAALVTGARNMVGVAIAMASAGIIVGVVSLTGVGISLSAVIEVVSGGSFLVALLLTAAAAIILGMGLPTTANYIVVIAVMGPVMVDLAAQNGLVVSLVAIHFFVFYFGLLSGTTPPVAIDAFVGAAVARADPFRTSIQAFIYSGRQAILPFMFLFNPQLLLINVAGPLHVVFIAVVATLAMVLFAASIQGWLLTRSRIWESAVLMVVALTLLRPGFWLDLLHPPYEAMDPIVIEDVVAQAPDDTLMRIVVRGETFTGREVERIALLDLGAKGAPGSERLEAAAGLKVETSPEGRVAVTSIRFGGPAQRIGVDYGWEVTELRVSTSRPAKEWFLIPALLLGGLVTALQWRRRRATPQPLPLKGSGAPP